MIASFKDKRTYIPVLVLLLVVTTSWIVYNMARYIDNESAYLFTANTIGTLFALSTFFSPIIVYLWTFKKGARPSQRFAASLVIPFLWATKECIRVSTAFGFVECLYYYFNPLNIFYLCFVAVQISIAVLICSSKDKAAGLMTNKLTLTALASLVLGTCFTILIYVMDRGEPLFWMFMNGFRTIFGTGV